MRIANIGWAGNKNWGDDRIAYCLRRYFRHDELVFFNGWIDAITNIEKLNSCDYLLMGGGGLIFRGFNRYISFIKSIKIPSGCVGISIEVNKLHSDMKDGLDLLVKRSDFIYVRDSKSKSLLNNHYKVIVGPDICFLYPYTPLKILGKNIAINLRNWPWWDQELFSDEDEFFKKIDKKIPYLKYVYPFKKWDPYSLVYELIKKHKNISPIPFYFGSYDVSDEIYLKTFFSSVPNRSSIHLFNDNGLLIGMRLHSIIFATQLGMPFISLSYEPKNENYCSEVHHPELSIPLKQWKDVYAKITYVQDNYARIQNDLLLYSEKSKNQTKYIFDRIDVLMRNK